MDPADCSASEVDSEMERLVNLLDRISQADSLQATSVGLSAVDAMIKNNPGFINSP